MIPEELGKIDQFLGDSKVDNGTRKENPRVFNLIMQWKVSFETEEAIQVSHKHTKHCMSVSHSFRQPTFFKSSYRRFYIAVELIQP